MLRNIVFLIGFVIYIASNVTFADDIMNKDTTSKTAMSKKAIKKTELLSSPIAKKEPIELVIHNDKRVDNYFWLKNREQKDVINYLEAENKYTSLMMKHTEQLQQSLFAEIKGRIKQEDKSVPYKDGNYLYYTRYEDGNEYPIYCRKPVGKDIEQIILNVNELAKGHAYFSVDNLQVSNDGKILSYAVDKVGRRIYDIYFKDLENNSLLQDTIPNATPNLEWANDNKTVFYAMQDPVTLRPNKIYRHILGEKTKNDKLIYEEKDDTFDVFVDKSKSKKYLFVVSAEAITTEYKYLDADDINSELKVFAKRESGQEYYLDHISDAFYIRTNFNAENFRLMQATLPKSDKKSWMVVLPYNHDFFLENFELFNDFIVVEERNNGLLQFKILNLKNNKTNYIHFKEPAYLVSIAENVEPNTNLFRFLYTSMTTPNSIIDYDMNSQKQVLLKEQEVLGGFNKENYKTERIYAVAQDGTKIPISLVYRKNLRDSKHGNPLVLYGYGSYGISIDPTFSASRLSLLDRGFVFAIAHVRGGQELGRAWHDNGKLLHKKNTFTDYIACAEFLLKEKYANKDNLFGMGGSAGGLLMGAVINMKPTLFNGVVADVPFVDSVTTMLDASIPLTTGEYVEWGNPNNKEYYDYILSYSPYDNVKRQNYPNILVMAGLHDSQVQYWEPAKWVAKLREYKTDDHKLLLKTDMSAGHGGATGRYNIYKDLAFEYAFILDLVKL